MPCKRLEEDTCPTTVGWFRLYVFTRPRFLPWRISRFNGNERSNVESACCIIGLRVRRGRGGKIELAPLRSEVKKNESSNNRNRDGANDDDVEQDESSREMADVGAHSY